MMVNGGRDSGNVVGGRWKSWKRRSVVATIGFGEVCCVVCWVVVGWICEKERRMVAGVEARVVWV